MNYIENIAKFFENKKLSIFQIQGLDLETDIINFSSYNKEFDQTIKGEMVFDRLDDYTIEISCIYQNKSLFERKEVVLIVDCEEELDSIFNMIVKYLYLKHNHVSEGNRYV